MKIRFSVILSATFMLGAVFSHQSYSATLSSRAEMIDWWVDSSSICESKQAPKRKELIKVVEANESKILYLADVASNDKKNIKIGPVVFINDEEFEQNLDRSETSRSWDQVYERYLKMIQGSDSADLFTKDNSHSKEWSFIRKRVLELLNRDEDRLVSEHPNFYKGASADYLKVITEFQQCLADETCTSIAESLELKRVIASSALYSRAFGRIGEADSAAEKRENIDRLFTKVLEAYRFALEFNSNKTIQRTSASELVLPLDAGPFAGEESVLAKYIEETWQSPSLKLKVKWVSRDAEENKEVFHFRFDPSGAFSFVTRMNLIQIATSDPVNENAIYLTKQDPVMAIAHEIGHVLGFRDHYYLPWDEKQCAYLIQFELDDIMSGSFASKRVVTDAEWAELEQRYPWGL